MRGSCFPTEVLSCSSLVLFRVGTSTWVLTHEDGDRAERDADLRELRRDLAKAGRGVQAQVLALAALVPAGGLQLAKVTGLAAAARADTTAFATFTGLFAMSVMSLFLHSAECRLILRDMGRLKKGR